MRSPDRVTGVPSPVVTLFTADLARDPERFVRHCRWLLSQQVSLAAFGTNSEANSLAVEERIDEIRGVFQARPMIPALEAAIAQDGGDPGWATVRPPLTALGPEQTDALVAELDRRGFAMPGLGG